MLRMTSLADHRRVSDALQYHAMHQKKYVELPSELNSICPQHQPKNCALQPVL